MKVNKNFVIRRVGSKSVAVPVGKACKAFKGTVKLNDTARLIWESLLAGDTEEQTVRKMTAQYELSEEHAHKSYRAMLEKMAELGAVSLDE